MRFGIIEEYRYLMMPRMTATRHAGTLALASSVLKNRNAEYIPERPPADTSGQ